MESNFPRTCNTEVRRFLSSFFLLIINQLGENRRQARNARQYKAHIREHISILIIGTLFLRPVYSIIIMNYNTFITYNIITVDSGKLFERAKWKKRNYD